MRPRSPRLSIERERSVKVVGREKFLATKHSEIEWKNRRLLLKLASVFRKKSLPSANTIQLFRVSKNVRSPAPTSSNFSSAAVKMVAEKPVSLLAAKQPQIKKLILNLCLSSETTFFFLFFFSLLVFSIHGIRHFSGRELRQLGDGGGISMSSSSLADSRRNLNLVREHWTCRDCFASIFSEFQSWFSLRLLLNLMKNEHAMALSLSRDSNNFTNYYFSELLHYSFARPYNNAGGNWVLSYLDVNLTLVQLFIADNTKQQKTFAEVRLTSPQQHTQQKLSEIFSMFSTAWLSLWRRFFFPLNHMQWYGKLWQDENH